VSRAANGSSGLPHDKPDAALRFSAIERRARHVTGLILFSFATTHFLNHACGLLRLDAMEAARLVLLWPWRTVIGQVLLYGSFAVHGGLGLYALYRRRHFRMPRGERWQLLLGLSIPTLFAAHAINVRLGTLLFGLDDSYPRVLTNLWFLAADPGPRMTQQFLLLLILWTHGCLGIAMWLRPKPWYPRWAPMLAVAITLLPVLAVLGIAEAGWQAVDAAAVEPQLFRNYVLAGTPIGASLTDLRNWTLALYGALVIGVLTLRALRQRRERRDRPVVITYPAGRAVTVPHGFSVLEASRWAGIDHASICGGRGRCSTCRVLVTAGLEGLPPASALERTTLERIGAPARVRLACQLRPGRALAVIPLLSTDDTHPHAVIAASHEREIAAIFVDLRDSTRLADGRLPYDALYIVDRYVSAVSHAVETHGGQVTSVAGDGITAFFGADCTPVEACQQALRAIEALWRALDALGQEILAEFHHALRFGVGCHVGLAVIGELSHQHTVQFLGEVGNIAARLEGMTKALDCVAVLSRDVVERAGFDMPIPRTQRVRITSVTADVETIAIRSAETLAEWLVEPATPHGSGVHRLHPP
jgi:adenylate cyclase